VTLSATLAKTLPAFAASRHNENWTQRTPWQKTVRTES
jgi:hypothetical protein